MQISLQPGTEENAPISTAMGNAMNRVKIIRKLGEEPFLALIQILHGVVESLPVVPRARHDVTPETLPLRAPVLPQTPGAEENDLVVFVPKLTQCRCR
jgi:hypothetical protein